VLASHRHDSRDFVALRIRLLDALHCRTMTMHDANG
jgi:hypothetical protein